MKLTTTLALLKKHSPCESGWQKLLASMTPKQRTQLDRRITIAYIIKSNDVADALWALRAVPESQAKERDKLARLFAIKCAKRVLPIFEKRYPEDKRPREAIAVAYRYVMGRATKEELETARTADASAAYAAARDSERRWQAKTLKAMLK